MCLLAHFSVLRSHQSALANVLQVCDDDLCSELQSPRAVALRIIYRATHSSSAGADSLHHLVSNRPRPHLTYPVCCVPLSFGDSTVGAIRRHVTCKASISATDAGLSKCTAEVTGTAPCCNQTTFLSKPTMRAGRSSNRLNLAHCEVTDRPFLVPTRCAFLSIAAAYLRPQSMRFTYSIATWP